MEEQEPEDFQFQRKIEIKKIITISFISLIIFSAMVIVSLYFANIEIRNWIDINVLKKDIKTEDVMSIDLNTDKTNQIYCYSNNICILKDKNLIIYNSNGIKDTELTININTAIFDSNENYLAVAEKNGQEFCVVLDKTLLLKEKVDGEIFQIHINKNGYTAIVSTDTTYKSIITLYSPEGKIILKNYLATTRVADVDISNDNNYVAFAEIDSSGTLISSKIKIISTEKAKTDASQAIIYTYDAPISKMITKIKYHEKNQLICMYNDSIEKIKEQENEVLEKIENNITFASINLNNQLAYIEEETSGLLNYNSILTIENTQDRKKNQYNINEIAKDMYAYGNVIAINVGTEIYFINTNGMLLKKYTSNQEITNVIISNNLGLIIYKDKIEIINF